MRRSIGRPDTTWRSLAPASRAASSSASIPEGTAESFGTRMPLGFTTAARSSGSDTLSSRSAGSGR
jgi:hypothetical protein